jgi:TetR/AcrR family transcriptional regulator, transcriptional repressor for nem operon
MPHKAGRKDEGRARILSSAARGFRANGFGGLGIDGIAKDAGVTSGGFYAHFPSKAAAFRETVAAGMADLYAGVAALRESLAERWRAAFVDFYLGERRTCQIGESCALQALATDVARSDNETREIFERELRRVVDLVADGLQSDDPTQRRQEAITLLALLAGSVSIARAVNDPALSQEIADAVRNAARNGLRPK